ncbi:hypothetical protein J4221_02760 [Candidatus Pacearchaeota archaeon]|nr:hypothetical protein [Candidatus Pacearchaeota archaeon]
MDSFKDFSLEERKRKLARMLGKSLEEIEEYSINFLYDSIEHIGSGGAVVFANRHNQSFIYDVPVTGEKIERDLDQIFKYSLDEFLGYVVERKNEKYNRICKLNWHDWHEYGVIEVTFADNTSMQFQDNNLELFQKYFRKPRFLNPSTYPTFGRFLAEFNSRNGNLSLLKKDYQILFQEPLPIGHMPSLNPLY